MRKLVVSTCRSIINVECTLDKQQKKLRSLAEHVTLGTIPKELLLPNRKALFEDEQSKVYDILHTACQSLLRHRIHETTRKIQETHSKKHSLEQKMFSTLIQHLKLKLRLCQMMPILEHWQQLRVDMMQSFSKFSCQLQEKMLSSKPKGSRKDWKEEATRGCYGHCP